MTAPKPCCPWRQLFHWWAPLCLMTTICMVSGGNPAPLPFNFISLDKLIHLLVFGLLATSLYRVKPEWHKGMRAIIAITATALFGLADELHQSATPGRMMELDDWIADVAGAVLAVTVYQGWGLYRRCLEMAVFPRKLKNISAV